MGKRYSLIIFDWDGTLMDSVSSITRALQFAAEKMALPVLNEEAYRHIIGLSLESGIYSLYPQLNAKTLAEYIGHYRGEYLRLEEKYSAPFPGVIDGLNSLRAQGISMAVATGKGRAGLDRLMADDQYGCYFDANRSAEETRSKPDPLMLEQLLDELDVPVGEALMVGDTGFDLQMAENIGMDRVAVTYGAHPKEKLLSYEPVFVAGSFDDLIEWIGVH